MQPSRETERVDSARDAVVLVAIATLPGIYLPEKTGDGPRSL
jgi:hypothetical protein